MREKIMLKSFLEFLATGMLVLTGYGMYFIVALVVTFILGLPIGLGIYLINDAVKYLFSGV